MAEELTLQRLFPFFPFSFLIFTFFFFSFSFLSLFLSLPQSFLLLLLSFSFPPSLPLSLIQKHIEEIISIWNRPVCIFCYNLRFTAIGNPLKFSVVISQVLPAYVFYHFWFNIGKIDLQTCRYCGIKGNILHKQNKAVWGIYLPINFSQLDECCTVFIYLWVKLCALTWQLLAFWMAGWAEGSW